MVISYGLGRRELHPAFKAQPQAQTEENYQNSRIPVTDLISKPLLHLTGLYRQNAKLRIV
jgi:hypothetical protein